MRAARDFLSFFCWPNLLASQHMRSKFVLVGGSIIAFNSGFANSSFVSGRLTPTGANQSVAGFTSSFTKSAMALVDGDLVSFGYHTCLMLMRYIIMFGVWGFDLGRD
jgi:hypothetical protein